MARGLQALFVVLLVAAQQDYAVETADGVIGEASATASSTASLTIAIR